jgi:hypothetical protein
VPAIHPLASDRDSVYRFSGGDTIVRLQLQGRSIPVVRVHVTPRPVKGRFLLFEGDLDIAADRKSIIRMRGSLVDARARTPLRVRLQRAAVRGTVLIDIEEGEFDQSYWLPTTERLEIQERSSLSRGFRPVARIVTTFRDQVADTLASHAVADSAQAAEHLTFAPSDSLNDFSAWSYEIGAKATEASATDFDDIVRPDTRPGGPPRLVWGSDLFSDVFRFDRVEGLYTGVAGTAHFGARAPNLTAMGHAGWAWREPTARGAVALRRQGDPWALGVAAQRELENTNDFVPTLEGVATFGALFGSVDDFDYVDRTSLTLSAARALDPRGSRVLRLEAGPGRDASEIARLSRGLIRLDSVFRPNRPATPGSYFREKVSLDVNPGVSGQYLEPGVGVTLAYERGDGGLSWQRADGRVTARRTIGAATLVTRLEGAALLSGAPTQKVIEFGQNEGLPGYQYKEFGGDRAVLGHIGAAYALPYFRAPLRLRRWLTIPGPTPTFAVGFQGGWSAAVRAETRAALASFGSATSPFLTDPAAPGFVPLTRPTGGIRSTFAVSFDLFGGAIGIGVARPLDSSRPWRFVLGSAQQW